MGTETILNYPAGLTLKKSAIRLRLARLKRPDSMHLARNIVGPIVVGLALGAVLVYARRLPSKWAGLVTLATMAPTVVLLAKDMRKLLLITLVVDIPLGLDITLGGGIGHLGGAGGFEISLMTMVLVAGYALWLTNRPVGGKPKVYTHKDITMPALVYLFTMLVSAFQAVDVRLSITQLFLEVQFFLMYFYVINHVKGWASVRLIFTTLVVCLLLESLVMLLQYFTGFQFSGSAIRTLATRGVLVSASSRVGGTMRSPNAAATYLAASLAITFAAYLTDNRLVNKRLALTALLTGAAALVTTQARSGWTGFVVAMLILAAQALRKHIGVKAILLFCIVAVLIGAGFSTQIKERLTTDDYDSAESRIWHAKLAFNILNDRNYMFTGVGLNNLWLVMRDYLPLEMMGRTHLHVIHNKYLIIWTETGLFGLLSFLWLLLAGGRRALQSLMRTKDAYVSIIITGLLAALVVCLLLMASYHFAGRMRPQMIWFILALIAATSQLDKETEGLGAPVKAQQLERPSHL